MSNLNADAEEHVARVRRQCLAMVGAEERLSHGEVTFFVRRKVFAMCSTDHHHDGHIAVVIPAPPGYQESLIASSPKTYYRPPYVGGKGWVGIELAQIEDEDLAVHLYEAWQLVSAGKKPRQPN